MGLRSLPSLKTSCKKKGPEELYGDCVKHRPKREVVSHDSYQQCRNGAVGVPLSILLFKKELQGIQLNITALTELSFHFIQAMKKHGRQSYIMNVSSLVSFLPAPNYAVYAAGKAYVRHFSDALYFELEQTNIHVHCFCPGGTVSGFMNAAGQQTTNFAQKGLMPTKRVAEIGLQDMFLKKRMSIPGLGNKLSFNLSKILPDRVNKYLLHKIMARSIE